MTRKPPVLPSLAEIQYMIDSRPKSVTMLHLANITQSSINWVSKLARGKIPNPGYQRIAAIYAYLMAAE